MEKQLDCTNATRGVWLVKVPKYVSQRWSKARGDIEVGRLKITKHPGTRQAEVLCTLSDTVTEDGEQSIPKNYCFAVGPISQTFENDTENENLNLEGKVVQRAECHPEENVGYLQLKKKQILKASQPTRTVKQLDKLVQNYKPVSDHKHNIEYEERKKSEGKKARDDKEKVMDMLFAAFEKHQYYNIKDLVRITKQPVTYLKEVLKDVCIYNLKNPHKNMWELKPEYRHYKSI